MRADGRSSFIYTSFVYHLFSRGLCCRWRKRSRHFLARNWIGGVRTIFQFLYSHANVFIFCLNYIFVFSLFLLGKWCIAICLKIDFEFSFILNMESDDGCVQKCYHIVILGNVCALHIEPTLSFIFLSYFSLLHLIVSKLQLQRHFFVLWWFLFFWFFCSALIIACRRSSFSSLLMISALIHLSFPLTIFLPTPVPHREMA